MTETKFLPTVTLDQVPAGGSKAIDIGGKSILLCNTRDRIFAVANRCSHAEEALECGRVRAGWISCPLHGARFDLETGAAMNPPATLPIETFAVRMNGEVIEVAV
jgi:3-phenylpropionate/trans-cinnamate dioxygenase ferredoxin subunit